MKWRILAVLYALNLFCGNGYAREISPDGEVSREQLGKDYVYFPYRDCVVFTVRSVFKNSKGRIVLLGAVNHVLRGKLKVRSHESMEFESRDCDLNFEELKNTKNRTWVIAFNGGFWRQSREDPLPVQCLSFKSSGKPLSKESIREWESKLSKTHFHYCSGWLVTMLDEAKPSLRAHERVLKLRIDEILVENQRNQALDLGVETPYAKWSHDYFRAGEIVQCR